MKIDFLVWNGKQYVLMQHDWIMDEITVINSGVMVKLNKKPAFTAICSRCGKKHTADTKEQAETNALQCNHLEDK